MDFQIRQLTTLSEAKELARCVYETYGHTFHRSYLYNPKRTLKLNTSGHLTSFLAMDGEKVIGHLAAIRPDYEFSDQKSATWGAKVREMGLGMVRPICRVQGVQTALVEPAIEWCQKNGIRGNFTKCVTETEATQKIALKHGATPCSILIGSVPFWVSFEDSTKPRVMHPISTIAFYRALSPSDPQVVYLPEPDRDLFTEIYTRLGEARDLRAPEDGPKTGKRSTFRVFFDPAKLFGRIHVLRAGPDLQEAVLERFRWLMAGRLRHVLIAAPLTSPFTARAVPAWKRAGMGFSGFLPCLSDSDMLIMQGVNQEPVSNADIHIVDELSARLRDRALADVERARQLPRITPESVKGQFFPSSGL